VRIILNDEMSAYIAFRIAEFPTESEERIRWQSCYVAEFSALPLYLGWFETIGIRPDGEFISWSTENEFAGVKAVEERTWMLSALIVGAKRYPELRRLLPQRGPDDLDCKCFQHPKFVSVEVLCGTCGGIGWLPSTSPTC
jgi:hypothetical protein